MKAYGRSRRSMLTCRAGCCRVYNDKNPTKRELADRVARKTARAEGRKEVTFSLFSV